MGLINVVPWKDPRLALGVLLIAGGGIAGSVLLGGEDSIPVLRAQGPIAAGSVLEENQFVVTDMPAVIGTGYVRSGQIPAGAVAAHSLSEGELLYGSALGETTTMVDLTLMLLADPPSSVGAGGAVQIWRVRSAQYDSGAEAYLLASEAILISVDATSTTSVAGAKAQVRVNPADVPGILEVLGTQDGLVLVSQVGLS